MLKTIHAQITYRNATSKPQPEYEYLHAYYNKWNETNIEIANALAQMNRSSQNSSKNNEYIISNINSTN